MAAFLRYQPRTPPRINQANPITVGLQVLQTGASLGVFARGNGGPSAIGCPHGVAQKYVRASSQYLSLNTTKVKNSPFTIFVVAAATEAVLTGVDRIFVGLGGAAQERAALYINQGKPAMFSGSGATSAQALSANALVSGRFYGITGRVIASNNRDVWVNGVQTATNTTNVPMGDTSVVTLGAYWLNGAPQSSLYLEGQIALALLWDRALSDAEIRSISDNPWQVFAPRRDIYIPDQQAAPAFVSAWAAGSNVLLQPGVAQ